MNDDDQYEKTLGKAYDARLLRRLLPFAKAHSKLALGVVVIVLIQVLAEQAAPFFLSIVIDGPVPDLIADPENSAAWDMLSTLSIVFVIVLAIELSLRFFSTYGLSILGQRIIFNLRSRLYQHLQSLPLRFYDRKPVGLLVTRTTSDIEAIGEVFSSGLVVMFADVLKIIVILVIMFSMNWQLALIILIMFPVIFGVTTVFRVRARSAYRAMRTRVAVLNSFLVEALGGLFVTRMFAQEKKQNSRYEKRNKEYFKSCMSAVHNFALFFPAVELVAKAATALLLWYGFQLVSSGSEGSQVLRAGEFVAFFIYTERLFRPIRELSERYTILQSAMASTERVMNLIDETNDIADPESPTKLDPNKVRGEIEFRNVWSAYVGEQWVLKDVSFKVMAGNNLALVGATGSGKTTIINLICRFYDVNKGQILVDGIDIRQLSISELRRSFGLVLQDVFLFAGSVLDNLRLGNENISRNTVVEAARTTGAASFIERLDNNYDEFVAERGSTFSTGEKQLIAFARALAFDPRILILDEATANIDSETEALIQEGLSNLMRGRTTVAVAHRLSTIQNSDEILVLHNGEIVERGNHQELLALKGRYYKLYMLQFDGSQSPRLTSTKTNEAG